MMLDLLLAAADSIHTAVQAEAHAYKRASCSVSGSLF